MSLARLMMILAAQCMQYIKLQFQDVNGTHNEKSTLVMVMWFKNKIIFICTKVSYKGSVVLQKWVYGNPLRYLEVSLYVTCFIVWSLPWNIPDALYKATYEQPFMIKNQVIWTTFYTGKVNVWIWTPVDVARNCRDLDCVRAADRQRNR